MAGAASCGDGPVTTGDSGGRPGRGGSGNAGSSSGQGGQAVPAGAGVGDACSDDEPCRAGLACNADSVCEPGHSLAQGEPCVIGPECEDGLQCVAGSCVPAGDGVEGDSCVSDTNCMSGLRCAIVGFGAQCTPAGTGDVGDECVASPDCYGGLICTDGACAPNPSGLPFGPPWSGVECELPVEGDPVKAYFEVPGAEDAEEGDFFRLPFPNDARAIGGNLDLSGFPTPGSGLLGYDIVARYVDAIEANDHGFGTYGTVYFRFSGSLDIDTVRDNTVVHFVDVTPGAPENGDSAGHGWYLQGDKTPYICYNWLGVRRPTGAPMLPGHTYAVWLSTDAKASDGSDIERSQNLVSVLGDSAPSDPVLADVHAAYAPLRDYLEAELVDTSQVLNAAVFTVAPVQDPMSDLADAIEALPPPTSSGWVLCADGVDSPCPDADADLGRACADGTADYDEYHALVSLPVYQVGDAPYTTEGGSIEISDDPPREQVCLSLTVPKATAMPAEGYPLVIFAHGTGGSFRSHVRDDVAGVLASASPNFAVLGIDQVVHGPRRNGSEESPDNLFFNFQNPDAARGNPLQGAADQLSLARFAAALDLSASDTGAAAIKVNPAMIYFFGHSQGSTEGSLAVPFSEEIGAAVLSGNGASLIDALLNKTSPVDIAGALPIALSDPTVTTITTMHPVLSLLQQWIDPADPLNFARAVTRSPIGTHPPKHVFQTFGLEDTFSPPVTMQIYAEAGGLSHVTPDLTDLELGTVDPPLYGNVDHGGVYYTLGVRQYEPASGDDGHFVVFDVNQANSDMVHFFETATVGPPEIGQ
ncbi:MAG TPA: hypothetical protein VM686_36135 [Polyangiaceae bacterium]|nr:hypothetical protein [Polyangiaceae bacterium]